MKKLNKVFDLNGDVIPTEKSFIYDVVLEFRRSAPSVITQVRKYRCVSGNLKGTVIFSYCTSDAKTRFEYFGSLKDCAKQFRNFVHDVVSLDFLEDGSVLPF